MCTVRLITFCLTLVSTTAIHLPLVIAQQTNDPVTIGEWQSLESKVLDETRRFMVSTPSEYDSSEAKYHVLYLLDGPAHFHHTTGLVEFLVNNDLMPPTLVVAVANTNRNRDMTPELRDPNEREPTEGGADQFITFFRDELIPFIDENYRTSDYRILIGHSYGGLFAIHTLVHSPDTFDAYIAISPSLQWDDQALVSQAEEFFSQKEELAKSLYMTSGNEGFALTGGLLKIAGILEEHAPSGFEWGKRLMPEESHNSVVYRSTRQGLEFIFSDFSLKTPEALYEAGGIEALHAFYSRASEKYGVERKLSHRVVLQTVFKLLTQNRLGEARAVLEHDPENFPPIPFFYLEIAKRYGDDKEQAIDCYSAALKLNPASQAARVGLSQLGVDPATVVAEPDLSEETLQEYAGDYVVPDSDMVELVKIHLENGKLSILLPGQTTSSQLTAVSQTEFYHEDEILMVEFVRDDDDKVAELILLYPTQAPARFKRQ